MDVIRREIRDTRCRSIDGRWFVPEGLLATVLSSEIIRKSLADHCDVKPYAVQGMTDAIERGGRKAFATLIMIREEKQLTAFLEHYLPSDIQKLDSSLPFSLSELEKILSRSIASEFCEYQWIFMAPVFTHRLHHRSIPAEMMLPFVDSRRIGGGGFGDVYEIVIAAGHHNFKDKDRNQPARLVRKELRKGFGDGDLWAEVGSNEHQIMSYLYHLEHPNILPLLTSYTYNGIPNFLLPLAEGGDLEHLLTQNGRPRNFSRNAQFYGAMSGLASGLQTLHEYKSEVLGREMIGYHHDLKPKNILVSKGRFILSDFGLSKLKTAEDSRTPFKMGQGHYLAPECEDPELDFSKGIVSRASDVWSLGCILLEILIFMAEGGDSLIRFRESRSIKQGFLTTRTFFHEKFLNPAVDRRLNEMANSHDDLISQSVALIRQMLVVPLEERMKASQITLGFSAISIEACYLTLNAAFRSVKWRIADTETIMEWEKFRHLADLLIIRDNTTTNPDTCMKQSRFFADRSQVESLHDTVNRTMKFLDDPSPLNDFATKLTSQLKQLTTLLECHISEIPCDEASTPAEANSPHHATHEPTNGERSSKLDWTDSILAVPMTKVRDCRNVIIASNEKFLAVEDNRGITIYALPSGNKVQTIRDSIERDPPYRLHRFAFTPNGKNLLVCWISQLRSYHVRHGGSGFDILFPPQPELYRSPNSTRQILTGVAAVSTDSKHVAFGVLNLGLCNQSRGRS